MKLIICDDLHITANNPRNRIDDYYKTQLGKIKFILKTAKENNARGILIAGDIFNSAKTPYWVVLKYYKLFIKHKTPLYLIPGQHDMLYHNKKEYKNTPLAVLEGVSPLIYRIKNLPEHIGDTFLYGCGWEEKIPEIIHEKKFNILLIHKMFTYSGPEWPGHEGYEDSKKFLKKHNFNLVVSGDNHKSFIVKHKDKTLINAGAIMRSKSNEIKNKPCIYLFNTKNLKAKQIFIPVKSYSKVFNLEKIKDQEAKKEDLKIREFINAATNEIEDTPNFLKTLAIVIEKTKFKSEDFRKGVNKLIDKFVEEASAEIKN